MLCQILPAFYQPGELRASDLLLLILEGAPLSPPQQNDKMYKEKNLCKWGEAGGPV